MSGSRIAAAHVAKTCVIQVVGPAAVGGGSFPGGQPAAAGRARAKLLGVALVPLQVGLWQYPEHGRRTCSPRTAA
jgi:hypothetical protein